jgi:hypothetical protein
VYVAQLQAASLSVNAPSNLTQYGALIAAKQQQRAAMHQLALCWGIIGRIHVRARVRDNACE